MKSKLLVLTLAPAMLIAVSRLAADGDNADAAGKKPPANHQQEMLARFDTDGDGKLSEEEKAAARAAMPERTGEMRKEMLARFDANGDGKLDDAERATAREAGQKHHGGQEPGGMHAQFMRRYDADGDGMLSDEEKSKAQTDWKAFVTTHDKDGDGQLSPEEGKAAKEAWVAEHPEAAAKMRAEADKDGDGTVSEDEKRETAKEMRKKRKHGGESTGAGE